MKTYFLIFASVVLFFGLLNSGWAKKPRVAEATESEVISVSTAPGYTTMLQFDSRPTSAVLGDQDAFKVEYLGNGLAIKPLLVHAKTNLFVFTNYDRFNFRLGVGPAAEAEYVLRVKRKRSSGYPLEVVAAKEDFQDVGIQGDKLLNRYIGRKMSCGGLVLSVKSIAWPESESTLLVKFHAEIARALVKTSEVNFEPGDFEILQGHQSLPIESLYLNRLTFSKGAREVEGTLVLRQVGLKMDAPIQLGFFPEAIKNLPRGCASVVFTRQEIAKRPLKPSKG